MAQTILNSCQMCWLLQLTSYNFIIHYHRGVLNPADGLSWRPNYFTNQVEDSVIDKLMPFFINKLAVKNTVILKVGMQCRESIFLKCGDDNPPTKDLIRMLSLQVII